MAGRHLDAAQGPAVRAGGRGRLVGKRLLRGHADPDIPAVLITGDTAPDRLREAAASGYPILHKPVSALMLAAVLADLVPA